MLSGLTGLVIHGFDTDHLQFHNRAIEFVKHHCVCAKKPSLLLVFSQL